MILVRFMLVLASLMMASAGCASRATAAAASSTQSRDAHEQLQAVLWMQSAAEYWALSAPVYARARTALDAAIADTSWTAAIEQERANVSGLPTCVVMDLDETLLDNSAFQGQLVLDRTTYSPERWGRWVALAAATGIPGAVDFVKYARSRNVRVVFVTNRTAQEEPATLRNLDVLLEPGTAADDVLVTGENGWSSDKSARRAFVARTHRILLLIGDDLNDFVSVAAARTSSDRLALAKQHAAKWLDRWVLIPNPAYGSWDRVIYPGATTDPEILLRKREAVRGFERK
jgi:5'-nucleotidase (lipoprotein e(P4) family)